MGSLIFLERVLLESLSSGPKSVCEMSRDLNISVAVIKNILFNMTKNNLVRYLGEKYILNRDNLSQSMEHLNQAESLSWEAREILDGMVEQDTERHLSQASFLKLRKMYLSDRDLVFFKAQLINLEKFLASLPAKPSKKEKTCDKTIFCWGMTNYNNVLKSILVR